MKTMFISVCMLLSCLCHGQVTPGSARTCTIEIYLVENGKAGDSLCRYCFHPTSADLADTPFIKNSEIVNYEMNKDIHYIVLSPETMQRLKTLTKTSSSSSAAFVTQAFALVVNGKPAYGGWFRSAYLSTPVDWITIPTPFDRDNTGKLAIYNGYMGGKIAPEYGDPRLNKILRECMN